MTESRYISATEAAEMLRISPATLYSYVSRGLLHSESAAGQARRRKYLREEVLRLRERKESRRDPAKAAARGLHWGSPVLESSLTLIEDGRLYYRGLDAMELALKASVEEVAALLWTGDRTQASALFAQSRPLPKRLRFFEKTAHLGPIERCQMMLPLAAALDLSAYDLRPSGVIKTGAHILQLLFSAVSGRPASRPIDRGLTEAWISRKREGLRALRAALIACADHELNVSAFTARCIASARATPYEVVGGALAALKGQRHGGVTVQVEQLFQDAARATNIKRFLAQRLRMQTHLPGFGHRLYPKGDPRAALLLSLAQAQGKNTVTRIAAAMSEAASELTGERPTMDFALVVLSHAFKLPTESPIALFALGRTMGWIAHAIEQYGENRLIRPRARYVGARDQVTGDRLQALPS